MRKNIREKRYLFKMNKAKLNVYFTKFVKSLMELKSSLKRKFKKLVVRKNYRWKSKFFFMKDCALLLAFNQGFGREKDKIRADICLRSIAFSFESGCL